MTTNAAYQVSLAKLGQLFPPPPRAIDPGISRELTERARAINDMCAIARRWAAASPGERPGAVAELRRALEAYAAKYHEANAARAMGDLQPACPTALRALTGEEKERALGALCKGARRAALWPGQAAGRQALVDGFMALFRDYVSEFHDGDAAAGAAEVTARCPEASAMFAVPPPVPVPPIVPPVVPPPVVPPPVGPPPPPPRVCPPGYHAVRHAGGDVCVRDVAPPSIILVPVAIRVPAWGGRPRGAPAPTVPAALIPFEEAARLLRLAEAAIRAVEAAAAKGAAPGASAADKAAAGAVGDCMEALTGAIGPAAALVDQLRKAVDAGRGAAVTREQVAAVEAFTDCVAKAEAAKESPRLWDAVVGIALPAAGALAVAL